MSNKHCPTEAELLAFVDDDLPPEKSKRIEAHFGQCSVCAKQAATLEELIADIGAKIPAADFDLNTHVAGVMKRLDEPPRSASTFRWLPWGGALAAAAAVTLFLVSEATNAPRGHLAARGGTGESSLSRDLGVQLYSQDGALRPLESGSEIQPNTALTAGVRNLASDSAYLLLFAVDAASVVHWITPEFTNPDSDPEATAAVPSAEEQLLPNAAVFDDLALGPLRVVAIVTKTPTRVSEVEQLPANALNDEGLLQHFPRAEIRQFLLTVSPRP